MSKTKVAQRPTEEKPKEASAPYKPLVPGCKVPFHIVQANRFELVDTSGRICGGLGFSDQGNPTITLTEDRGNSLRPRVELTLDHEGPALALMDGRGKGRVVMRVGNEGTCGLVFKDERGTPRMVFGIDEHGVPLASILTKTGGVLRFMKRAFQVPARAELEKLLHPLVEAGKKAEFLAVVSDRLDVQDTQEATSLWRDFRAIVSRERKGKPKTARSRTTKASPPAATGGAR